MKSKLPITSDEFASEMTHRNRNVRNANQSLVSGAVSGAVATFRRLGRYGKDATVADSVANAVERLPDVLLAREYETDIASWNWKGLRADCLANAEPDFDGEMRAETYIGSVLGIFPSGKVYALWTSNQTDDDVRKDEIFGQVLDSVAERNGFYITGSEGDGCDVFVGLIDTDSIDA